LDEYSKRVPAEIEADRKRLAELREQIDNLVDSLARGNHQSDSVLDRVAQLEAEANTIKARIEESEQLTKNTIAIPDQAWISEQLRDMHSIIEENRRPAALLLRRLLGKVQAFQVLPAGKSRGYVQLRVRVDGWRILHAILPPEALRTILDKVNSNDELAAGVSEEFKIDLGRASEMDSWAPQIARWRADRVLWKEICKRTGLDLNRAYRAWKRYVDSQSPVDDSPNPSQPLRPDDESGAAA